MKDGFIKVAAVTADITVADPQANRASILAKVGAAAAEGAKIIVLPELCLTGKDLRDLCFQDALLAAAKDELLALAKESAHIDALFFVGLPLAVNGKLYNVAAAVNKGEILGFVPKTHLQSVGTIDERRHFTPADRAVQFIDFAGAEVPFGSRLLFVSDAMPTLTVAVEIGEDAFAPIPPSTRHALAGAHLIVNLAAVPALAGKSESRKNLLLAHSARTLAAYVYADAGSGESSTDYVFDAQNLVMENGRLLAEATRFDNGMAISEVDLQRVSAERRRHAAFHGGKKEGGLRVPFSIKHTQTRLTRVFPQHPFVPDASSTRDARCDEILNIQSLGRAKRLRHVRAESAVLGISGGLDSTLALLVTARAFDSLGLPRENILSVTMPCFGTTDRTYKNACTLTERIGATLQEINIEASVKQHFADIGHDMEDLNATYENAQARERTQVLMDIANDTGALVVGTGDLSELALGWATYNGDHMSMYGVNAGVPKTLVRHLVRYYADTCEDKELQAALLDVLDTPVSPELLPPSENGTISQKTEDLVGPYELHDFFLYYMLRCGFAPAKIYRIACKSFAGTYDEDTVLRWMKKFYSRFFAQQFKRSCLPDGPKIGSVGVSPRGDLCMPSDAAADIWLAELEAL